MDSLESIDSTPTFAQIVKRKTRKNQNGRNSLIKHKQQQDNNQINSFLENYVDLEYHPMKINRKRDVKDGSVIIDLDTAEEANKLEDYLTKNMFFPKSYNLIKPKKRNPRLIIRGVPTNMTDERIMEELLKNSVVHKYGTTTQELERHMSFKYH